MFPAFAASLECRRPAFWLERAVTISTVRLAGLEPADHHVGATIDPGFICTSTVFGTETLAFSGGGAAGRGARLLLLPTVFEAMLRSITWTGGAAIKLACSTSTMRDADTTCFCKSSAVFDRARFPAVCVADPSDFRLVWAAIH